MSNKRKLGEGAAVVALAATLAATACDGKGSEIDRQREECFADHWFSQISQSAKADDADA